MRPTPLQDEKLHAGSSRRRIARSNGTAAGNVPSAHERTPGQISIAFSLLSIDDSCATVDNLNHEETVRCQLRLTRPCTGTSHPRASYVSTSLAWITRSL